MDAKIIDGLNERRVAKAARLLPVDMARLTVFFPQIVMIHATAAYWQACSEALGNPSPVAPTAKIMHHAHFRASRAPQS